MQPGEIGLDERVMINPVNKEHTHKWTVVVKLHHTMFTFFAVL